MSAYATIGDVYRELSAPAFLSRPRPLDPRAGDSFDPATGIITLGAHGYLATDRVRLVAVAAGALPGGATSAPLAAIPLDYWRFQLALTPGGAPLTFPSAGSGWGVQVDPEPRIAYFLDRTAEIINECLVAHSTPLERDPSTGEFPGVIVGVNARMAARRAVTSLQLDNAAFRAPIDRLLAAAAFDGDTDPPAKPGSLLGDWKMGKPVLPRPKDQTAASDIGARGRGRAPLGYGSGGVM